MFQTLKNAWKITELKNKILFTLLIVVLYRLGANIPIPYVDPNILSSFSTIYGGSILEYMSILSGGALSQATLFALSVSPYITASIVMQLLTIAIPALERLSKDGENGKKKITAITRYVTVALALITSYGYTMLLKANNWLLDTGTFAIIVVIACYCAGAALIMWLAEKINSDGIGNGISMILFANIISRAPYLLSTVWSMVISSDYHIIVGIILGIASLAITAAIIVMIVWFTNSERRIPIQYAKRVVGRKMYGGQGTNLPIKMNMAGVMPIIFASSIVSIPATIVTFITKEDSWLKNFVNDWFDYDTWLYLIIYVILIFAFSYFYIMISFNPVEVANNIKNNGGSVPGIRTGRPTAEYITKILNRITFIGAIFLAFIAGFPMLVNIITSYFNVTFSGIAFGGSSLLIVVGVALETVRELESQITMRNYKGFLD